ncbi:TPA: FliC/FljB family flagellin [Klebsiella aerogenes]|uniref:FliC/FljB family flagellin n=1 Tax=Klebsiella TaxID=570 RepID=UPI002277F9C9|nr:MULTISPECIES: FliC/FljB family flagellin [Klebsiella]MCY4762986.1 FliC/FljB family flagellin [Klebsiella aerogenes]MDM8055143.1 FliC/FljB family flagellin [Klebsiella aerogenes]MDM8079110.1 FliC/FljB family flagellin [Klebsiella aerogenes]MDU9364919.1 FliC/FljB family flagellin [Klebsiella sp. 141203]HDT5515147.1 FliC/FljB family flagellin [Klebsiella aerogenes]
MAQVINTNSLSLMAQNNLNKSQSSLGTAIERLSSGLRINSAKDDAAGQAISNRFTANIKGLTQASRNANDGISLAQTTEGALNEVNDNLQNIRRLTVQAQNGSNSSSDLQSIQDEITQRLSEIDRISQQTDFNGVKVLSSNQKLTIQVGANDNETIDIDLKDINKSTLNLDTFSVAFGVNKGDVGKTAVAANDSIQLDKTVTIAAGQKANSKDVTGYVKDDKGDIYARTGATEYYKVDSIDKDGTATFAATSATPSGATKAVTEGKISVKATDNADKDLANTFAYTGTEKGAPKYVIKDTSGATDRYYAATFDADGKVVRGNELNSTPATKDPLEALDKALSQVDQLRSSLGAVQNRFDSVINNLNSTVNNLSASQSRIQDADYATEVSNMSRANILQQAGTSVLAQANQSTQNVLSLLR